MICCNCFSHIDAKSSYCQNCFHSNREKQSIISKEGISTYDNELGKTLKGVGVISFHDLDRAYRENKEKLLFSLNEEDGKKVERIISQIYKRAYLKLKEGEDPDYPITFRKELSEKSKKVLAFNSVESERDLIELINRKELSHLKKAGERRISEILYFALLIAEKSDKEEADQIEESEDRYNDDLALISISGLESLKVCKKAQIALLQDEGILTFGDAIDALRKGSKEGKIRLIIKDSTLFEKELSAVISEAFSNLKENYRYIFLSREGGKRLEDISNDVGITRERVRQLEAKTYRSLIPYLEAAIKKVSKDGIIRLEDIYFYFDGDAARCVSYAFRLYSERLEYLSFASMFIENSRGRGSAEKRLLSALKSVLGKDGAFISEIVKKIDPILKEEDLSIFGEEDIVNLARKHDFWIYKSYISVSAVSKTVLFRLLVESYFPDGIKYNQNNNNPVEDLKRLREYAKRDFNLDLSDSSDRTLTATLDRSLIACDRGRAKAPSQITVSEDVLQNIKEYIEKKDDMCIMFHTIYSDMKDYLASHGINNLFFLAGIIKYYFEGDYEYGRDSLIKKGGQKESFLERGERLNEIIVKEGHRMRLDDFRKYYPGYSDVMFLSPIQKSRKILDFGDGTYYSIDLIELIDENKDSLRKIIEKETEKYGVVSALKVYEFVDEDFIFDNDLESFRLFSILESLFSDTYFFKRPYIYRSEELKKRSMKEFFISQLKDPDHFTRDDVKRFAWDIGMTNIARDLLIKDLKKEYYVYGNDFYKDRSQFPIQLDLFDDL